jgi:small conductance mechanosensitive channel
MDYLNKFSFLIAPLTVIVLSFIVGYIFDKIFSRFVLANFNTNDRNPTTFKFIGHIARAIIYLTGFGMAINMIPQLKNVATSMFASAGILAVAIGFASQNAFANIVSGIFIVIFKPFKVNDRIVFRDTMIGTVEDINLRHTIIRNFENRRIIIPNSVLNNEVIVNADLQEPKICRIFNLGISYDSDIDLAKTIIADEVRNHQYYFDNRSIVDIENGVPDVLVRVVAWADSSITLRVWVWAEDSGIGFNMECDLLESIKKRFDAEGIEIPFPHRTIVHKA